MKHVFVTFLAAVAAAGAWAAPELVWLEQEHDFGAFSEEMGIVNCVFRAVNTGDEPAIILQARANCGCTTPRYESTPVEPGDTLRLTVGYNASGRPGKFEKKVIVTTNTTPPRTTLYISGTVIGTDQTLSHRYPFGAGKMKLRDDAILFGDVTTVSVSSKYIEGVNASADTIRPRVVSTPGHINVTISPAAVAPGETFIIGGIFDGSKAPDWDAMSESFTITDGDGAEFEIKTAAIVREQFSSNKRYGAIAVEPRMFDLGRISVADRPVKLRLRISNSGSAPLKIRKISCADDAVGPVFLKKDTVKPSKSIDVEITVDPSKLAGKEMLNAKLIIIAADPVTPRTVVRLVGEVANP